MNTFEIAIEIVISRKLIKTLGRCSMPESTFTIPYHRAQLRNFLHILSTF